MRCLPARTAILLGILTAPILVVPACAQRIASLSQGKSLREIYAPIVAQANCSTVQVLVDGEVRVLGTVVADNLVLTKYSELQRKEANPENFASLSCRQGKTAWNAKQIAFDRPSDTALLRLKGAKLPTLRWRTGRRPQAGAFLATPDTTDTPCGIGILSAAPYVHTRPRAFLGIRFTNPRGGPAKLDEAIENGAARAAGLRGGDLVIGFGDKKILDTDALRDQIQACKPGDVIDVKVRREGVEKTFRVTLGTNHSSPESGQEDVWGDLSSVRSGFGRVLQHDTVLKPSQVGGPVVDLAGEAIGINIARAGRVETLALPSREVQHLVKRLLGQSK